MRTLFSNAQNDAMNESRALFTEPMSAAAASASDPPHPGACSPDRRVTVLDRRKNEAIKTLNFVDRGRYYTTPGQQRRLLSNAAVSC